MVASPEVWFVEGNPRTFPQLWAKTKPHAEYSSAINDLSVDFSLYEVAKLMATAALNLTGVVAPAAVQRVVLWNVGTAAITIKHQNAGSTAANRIITPDAGDYTLAAGDFVHLVYDTNNSRWILGIKVKRTGFKKEFPTGGAIMILNGAFWSLKHTGFNTSGAQTATIFYRHGMVIGSQDYGDDYGTTEDQEAKPILNGDDELVQVQSNTPGHAIFLSAAGAAAVTVSCRPNEQAYGKNA